VTKPYEPGDKLLRRNDHTRDVVTLVELGTDQIWSATSVWWERDISGRWKEFDRCDRAYRCVDDLELYYFRVHTVDVNEATGYDRSRQTNVADAE
jgi:hypothetical protein